MGLEYEVYSLHLIANGLYTINLVCEMIFPSSSQELKDDGLYSVISRLYLLRGLCEDVKVVVNKKNDASITKNKLKMKSLLGEEINTPMNIEWWKEIGSPPNFSGEDD